MNKKIDLEYINQDNEAFRERKDIDLDLLDEITNKHVPNLIAELKRCYKKIDLLHKAFMIAGNRGVYMTLCEKCDDIHLADVDYCPHDCECCADKFEYCSICTTHKKEE